MCVKVEEGREFRGSGKDARKKRLTAAEERVVIEEDAPAPAAAL